MREGKRVHLAYDLRRTIHSKLLSTIGIAVITAIATLLLLTHTMAKPISNYTLATDLEIDYANKTIRFPAELNIDPADDAQNLATWAIWPEVDPDNPDPNNSKWFPNPSIDDWGQHGGAYIGTREGMARPHFVFITDITKIRINAALIAAGLRALKYYDADYLADHQGWFPEDPEKGGDAYFEGDDMLVQVEWEYQGTYHCLNIEDFFDNMTIAKRGNMWSNEDYSRNIYSHEIEGMWEDPAYYIPMFGTVFQGEIGWRPIWTLLLGQFIKVIKPWSPHWVYHGASEIIQQPSEGNEWYTGCICCPWDCPGSLIADNHMGPVDTSYRTTLRYPELKLKKSMMREKGLTKKGDSVTVIIRGVHSTMNEMIPWKDGIPWPEDIPMPDEMEKIKKVGLASQK